MARLVVALQGPDDSGKTHIIRRVYNWLIDLGWVVISPERYEVFYRNGGREEGLVVGRNPIRGEIKGAVLERKEDSVKIGVVSIGDYPVNVDNFLQPVLRDYDCDAYLCATREAGDSTDVRMRQLVAMYRPDAHIEPVPKQPNQASTAATDRDFANEWIIPLINGDIPPPPIPPIP